MRKKALLTILLTGLAMLTACGDEHTDMSDSDQVAVPVSVIQARYQSITTTIEAPGTVQPRNRIPLACQINGFVHEMRVRAGDRVRSEAQQAHQAALDMQAASKAAAELADQTYTRYQKLFESRSVSPQEMDEVRTRRDSARAELASRESMVAASKDRIKQVEAKISQAKAQAGRAEVLMSYTRILAPVNGVVVERSADAGAAIFPGSPLLVIETTARPQVLASLPTKDAGHLLVGMTIRLKQSDSVPSVEGRVSEIIPQSNSGTHSVQFKVDLPPDTPVVHGQYMKLEVPIGTRDALLIARSAIREAGQLKGLFIVDEAARARFRLVKTAPCDSEQLEILSGVEEGESIIIAPDDRIVDGMPVEIQI
jgi:multidrug efflux pump subunit AcrA (membrane-fusion protein)